MSVICKVNKVSDPSSTTRAKQTVVCKCAKQMPATIEYKRNLIIHLKVAVQNSTPKPSPKKPPLFV